jgi:hypothetical protein
MSSVHIAALQLHRRIALKAIVRGFSWTTMPITWRIAHGVAEVEDQGNGQPVSLHLRDTYGSRSTSAWATTGVTSRHRIGRQSSAAKPEWPRGQARTGQRQGAAIAGRSHPADCRLPSVLAGTNGTHDVHTPAELTAELQNIYEARFASTHAYRNEVWKVLTAAFFQKLVPSSGAALDLGCGYGEFINNISCGTKYGMDLNPDVTRYLSRDVRYCRRTAPRPGRCPTSRSTSCSPAILRAPSR